MSVRTRLLARFDRRFTGERATWESGPLARSLAARERSGERPPRSLVGEKIAGPSSWRPLRPKQPARPEPNAPLLMRLVRSPFALAPARFSRLVVPRAAPESRAVLSSRPGTPFGDLLRELRGRSVRFERRPSRARPFRSRS